MEHPVLMALFNGRFLPWKAPKGICEESRGVWERIEIEKRFFTEKMSLDDRKRFEKLDGLYIEAAMTDANNYEADIYSHGFTQGALLMMDVMDKKEDAIDM